MLLDSYSLIATKVTAARLGWTRYPPLQMRSGSTMFTAIRIVCIWKNSPQKCSVLVYLVTLILRTGGPPHRADPDHP